MAQFPPAFDFFMKNEDSLHEYAQVPDVGGFAISGINSHSWPNEFAYIASIQQALRGPAVQAFYQDKFWGLLKLGGLNSQDLANRVLDEAVNAGPGTSIRLLQEAANACGCSLLVDGVIGPNTLETVNGLDEDRIIASFKTERVNRYKAIVVNNPDDEKYLSQWIARAEQ